MTDMDAFLNGDLPIGFGLGKTPEHWEKVISQIVDSANSTRNSKQTDVTTQDSDILTVEETALLLRCCPDRIRRIPRGELPARAGPGRQLLYLREDILDYLRSAPGNEKRGSGFGKRLELGVSNGKPTEFDLEIAKSSIVEN